MANENIIKAVKYAAMNGAAPIQFKKCCNAGGYARYFAGNGILYITANRMRINGANGFITQIGACSEDAIIAYIVANFDFLALDETCTKEKATAYAG